MIFDAAAAPRLPSSASLSRCALRERTSANSAATKKPLMSTSRTTASRSRTVIGGPRDAREARRYFGRSRRRSSGRRAQWYPGDARLGGGQAVDPAREIQVVLREAALGVGRERQPDLVPAVHED